MLSPLPFTVKVVGVSFVADYPANIARLEAAWARNEIGWSSYEPLPCTLVRNPENEHDTNAIEVHVEGVGMLGHLPAGLAARFAPNLDCGQVWVTEIRKVLVHPDYPDRPGIDLFCEPAPFGYAPPASTARIDDETRETA